MKRLLLIAAIAVLGATMYVVDPPRLTARETAATGAAVAPPVQSQVVRLAEASLELRRQGAPGLAAYDQNAEPRTQRLSKSK